MNETTEANGKGLGIKQSGIPGEIGAVRIADEVVAVIAGMAATGVKGVAGMSGGIAGGIVEAFGRKSFSKGVKVEVGEEEAIVDLYIVVDFGARIPDVAWEVQESVKNSIESMTGLMVLKVNIHVQGVIFPAKKEKNKEEDNTEVIPAEELEEELEEEIEEEIISENSAESLE